MIDNANLEVLEDTPSLERARVLRRRLGALLLERGLLEPGQLAAAFEEQQQTGVRLGEIVVARGWITRSDLMTALAEQVGLPVIDLAGMAVDSEVAKLLPENLAQRYQALPLTRLDTGEILVGLAEPGDPHALDDLRLVLGRSLSFGLVDPVELELATRQIHRRTLDADLAVRIEDAEEQEERDDLTDEVDGAPAIKYVNTAIARAIEERASDIHFVPEEARLVVRARIDGVVQELMTIPKGLQPAVLSRLKVMGSLDIAERRQPQDGRVLVRLRGKPVDLRIAVLPTTHGERVVLRVLQRAMPQMSLGDLGMRAADEDAFLSWIRQPHGAVIVCGPTGSGKTTTLYTGLSLLSDPGRVLVTIEDPVEYQIEGISQIEVNVKSGLTFARGLRTILRSDPDVILVGEVRDEETARTAVQAAMTGHLVLTTLHTHNAASAVPRLRDMGVDASLLGSSVNGIIAQRLARRLCLECRESYTATQAERELLGLADSPEPITLWRAKGCGSCRRTGFVGRVAVYEMLHMEGEIRRLLDASTEEIYAAARRQGMRTLREESHRLCLEGSCSLAEINRVIGDRAD